MTLQEVYEKYRHLDLVFVQVSSSLEDTVYAQRRDLWNAVKHQVEVQTPTDTKRLNWLEKKLREEGYHIILRIYPTETDFRSKIDTLMEKETKRSERGVNRLDAARGEPK